MEIGILKEIKSQENRIAMTPSGVQELTDAGHKVLVESSAGEGSGFGDEEYEQAGAELLSAADIFYRADMILKVKEPLPAEYGKIRAGQIIFTYFHFAASKELTEAMVASKAVCIAYETVSDKFGGLPLLTPMSQVAGRLAVQEGTRFLLKNNRGKGVLLGGVPGVKPAKVVIIGGGVVGTEAAKMAVGLGGRVCLLDISAKKMQELTEIIKGNFYTRYATSQNIWKEVTTADLVIGAVLIPGAKAPKLVTKQMVEAMEAGSVIIDVAVDQGGCVETMHATTHENPVFEINGVLHYGVANMPGAVPRTATIALSQATLPFVKKIATEGWKKAVETDVYLKSGLEIVNGIVLNEKIKESFGL